MSVAPQPISRNFGWISEKRPTQSTNRSQLSPTTIHSRRFFLTPRRIARRFYPLPSPRPSARPLPAFAPTPLPARTLAKNCFRSLARSLAISLRDSYRVDYSSIKTMHSIIQPVEYPSPSEIPTLYRYRLFPFSSAKYFSDLQLR